MQFSERHSIDLQSYNEAVLRSLYKWSRCASAMSAVHGQISRVRWWRFYGESLGSIACVVKWLGSIDYSVCSISITHRISLNTVLSILIRTQCIQIELISQLLLADSGTKSILRSEYYTQRRRPHIGIGVIDADITVSYRRVKFVRGSRALSPRRFDLPLFIDD